MATQTGTIDLAAIARAGTAASSALADSVEYIVGTQTAATGSWTGATRDAALVAGKTIAYKLPYAGSGNASLDLTLSGGGTTGAIPVYLGTTRMTTHFGAGSVINMTYDGAAWRATSIPNSNNYDRTVHSNTVKAASANASGKSYAVAGSSIIGYVASLGGYQTIVGGTAIDLSYPVLWATGNVAASGTFTNAYEVYPSCTLRNNASSSWTGTTYAMAFLVGTLSGSTLTLDTVPVTTSAPSAEDGKVYLPVGQMYSTYQVAFRTSTTLYAFMDGAFQTVQNGSVGDARNALASAAASLSERLDAVDGDVDALAGRVATTETSITALGVSISAKLDSSDARLEWLDASSSALTIGRNVGGSEYFGQFTATGISFNDSSGTALAELNKDDGLYAPKAKVEDELSIGGWKVSCRSDDVLAIKWTG